MSGRRPDIPPRLCRRLPLALARRQGAGARLCRARRERAKDSPPSFPARRFPFRPITARIRSFASSGGTSRRISSMPRRRLWRAMDAVPPGHEAGRATGEGWANQQLWMGHAAVTRADTHRSSETFARGGVGQAGVEANPFRSLDRCLGDARARRDRCGQHGAARTRRRRATDFSYALRLDADRPLVLQGDGGYSRKSLREQASYYYSQPNFSVKGSITIDDKPVEVTGQAWLDREWSSQPLASDQTGWDWLSLHFKTGEKLMLYRMRQTDGNHYGSGKWIAPDGRAVDSSHPPTSRMTPQSLHRDRGPQDPDRMAHRDSETRAGDRLHAAEREKLDGDELSLLGRPDQLCRQPHRIRISGDDGILRRDTLKWGNSAMYHFTALVTCLPSCSTSSLPSWSRRARGKFGVKVPAISGNADFERVFRVQMNTLEWMPIFLPSLWLFAIYIGDVIAAVLGAGLDRRPHPLLDRLFEGGRKTRSGFCDPGPRDHCLWVGALGAIVWRLVSRVSITVVPADPGSIAGIVRSRSATWPVASGTCRQGHESLTSPAGSPKSLAAGNALSPGTTASCL